MSPQNPGLVPGFLLLGDPEPGGAAPARLADTDVLVVGAGIAKLSVAYELARFGRKVTVLDRGRPARGMSARTSAHLSSELDDYYLGLIKTRNLETARHWAAHLRRGDVQSTADLRPGQGAITKIDGEAVAAYRTAEGELRLLSATCTHAGCVVRWNSFERCWDCPCHGSQFSTDGEPLQGPAHTPLEPFVREARRRASAD